MIKGAILIEDLPETDDTKEISEILQKFSIRQRLKPGPPSEDMPSAVEQDLKDAALILKSIENGHIDTILPQRDKSKDRLYLSGKYRISAEEENELAIRIQKYNDLDARNCLVMTNLGLVHLVANQFSRSTIRYEDLIQEGTIGLLRATETFEPNRGIRFSTYGVYWIRAKIQRYLQKIDRDDVPIIIGADMVEDDVGKRRRPRARKISIENSQDDDSLRSLSEILPAEIKDPEKVALCVERDEVIKEVLNGLVDETGDERFRCIIDQRLLAEEPQTLSHVGEQLNLSREGARLLEAKLLKLAKQKLKKWRKNNVF